MNAACVFLRRLFVTFTNAVANSCLLGHQTIMPLVWDPGKDQVIVLLSRQAWSSPECHDTCVSKSIRPRSNQFHLYHPENKCQYRNNQYGIRWRSVRLQAEGREKGHSDFRVNMLLFPLGDLSPLQLLLAHSPLVFPEMSVNKPPESVRNKGEVFANCKGVWRTLDAGRNALHLLKFHLPSSCSS